MKSDPLVAIVALVIVGVVGSVVAQEEWVPYYDDEGNLEGHMLVTDVHDYDGNVVSTDIAVPVYDDDGGIIGYDEYVSVFDDDVNWNLVAHDLYLYDADWEVLDIIENAYDENLEPMGNIDIYSRRGEARGYAAPAPAAEWVPYYDDEGNLEGHMLVTDVHDYDGNVVSTDIAVPVYDDDGGIIGYDEYVSVFDDDVNWNLVAHDLYLYDADWEVLDIIENAYDENLQATTAKKSEIYNRWGEARGYEKPIKSDMSERSTPVTKDLPPVFLKHPVSETVTPKGLEYTLRILPNDFIVVDDGGETYTVNCVVNGARTEIDAPKEFRLEGGRHYIQCMATDNGGLTSSISYTITVNTENFVEGLFASSEHEQRFEHIMRLHGTGLNDDHVKKFIKYFHKAGLLVFDIVSDGGTSAEPDEARCNLAMSEREIISMLSDGTSFHKKHCLELLAEKGGFSGVSLGI